MLAERFITHYAKPYYHAVWDLHMHLEDWCIVLGYPDEIIPNLLLDILGDERVKTNSDGEVYICSEVE